MSEPSGRHLDLRLAALAAVIMLFEAGAPGWLWASFTGPRAAVYVPPIMCPNCSNLGLPVAHPAFGDDGLALLVVLMVVQNTLQFAFGLWLLGERVSPRALALNPMLVATAVGLVCMAAGWQAPAVIEPAIGMLGEVSIPLMLISLGVRLFGSTQVQ